MLETPSQTAPVTSAQHIGALDGIRGLAIIAVLLYHYAESANSFGIQSSLLNLVKFGWCGVDLFFVLSGFLITGILYDSRESKRYFKNFYARRALRIFPLAWGALIIVTILAAIWPDINAWGTRSPLWVAFYLSNFVMAIDGVYSTGIMAHYWSLAIEEHFYFLWPFLVRAGNRQQLMMIAAGLVAFSLALRITMRSAGVDPLAIYLITPTRLDGLAIGALVALAARGPGGAAAIARPGWIAMCGGGLSALVVILLDGNLGNGGPLMQTIGYTLLAMTFGGAVIVSMNWAALSSVLSNTVLRWFGRYAYGLYVWHPILNTLLLFTPIKTMLGINGPIEDSLYMAAVFGVVVLVSLASYHLWEQPFLRLKRYFA